MNCPNCNHEIVIEYDIWNQSYWHCGYCGLYGWQLVRTSGNSGSYNDIILSPEEIEQVSEEWLNADEDVDWANSLNKAQLKKVVEWGDEECLEHGWGAEDTARKRCWSCWQVLLEEVKE